MATENRIDIVLPLGTGSKHKDLELRYALRSIEMHLSGYGQVWIIGKPIPASIRGVKHIPAADIHPIPDGNMMAKLALACNVYEISETFLYYHDDHFLMQDVQADKFPFYYQGTMQEYITKRGKDGYSQRVQNSLDYLEKNNHPTKYFDVHTPMLIEKEAFKNVINAYDQKKPHGYVLKSLYANMKGIEGTPFIDHKITKAPEKPTPVISTIPKIKHSIQRFLFERFPEPSKFEL